MADNDTEVPPKSDGIKMESITEIKTESDAIEHVKPDEEKKKETQYDSDEFETITDDESEAHKTDEEKSAKKRSCTIQNDGTEIKTDDEKLGTEHTKSQERKPQTDEEKRQLETIDSKGEFVRISEKVKY